MISLRPLIILYCLLCFQQELTAQQTTPKTLLWRISGNGLQNPSYLYGTMHLYDRRLFFFGDSVYNSIEQTEGFAMELNPNDMMDSIFSKLGAEDTTSLIRKMLDKKKYDSVAKKLEKRFGMPADKITRKKLMDEREGWYYKIHRKDDMKSVVDLYLYNIAQRQGKWVGGIEDVDDQFGIKDELGNNINIIEYINDDNQKEKKKYLEKMISIYTNADLDKLNDFSNSTSKEYKDILLLNRNSKMARRMDSLSHIRSTFFAVGAAHLPGDSGVIDLLRKRGFAVDPVFSSKNISPEKYTYTAIDIPWIKFIDPDSTYTVEMPGKVSNLDVLDGEMKFRVCADMVTNNFYMTAYAFASDRTAEEALDAMYEAYTSNEFKKLNEKKITNNGIPGIEVLSVKEDIYYRIQIFVAGNKYYLCIAGSVNKDNLRSKDVDRFFNSFTMNTAAEPKTANWVNYNNEEKAFTVSFPKKPAIDKLDQEESGEHMETTTYTSIDLKNGIYYMMIATETQKGFVLTDDSLVFNSKLRAYKEKDSEITDLKYFDHEGHPAMSFNAVTQMNGFDFVTKMLTINRSNRSYSIAVVAQKGKDDYPEITRFFRSFKLLPYKPAEWADRSPAGRSFNIWSPAAIELDVPDSSKLKGEELTEALADAKLRLQYLSHDANSATSYNVNVYPLSKYYWAKNDSTVLSAQLETYYSDPSGYFAKINPGHYDSLVYKKEVMNGNTKGYEILVSAANRHTSKKVRVLLHGDSVYHLFMLTDAAWINNENNNRFFTGFRFTNENIPTNAFTNKTQLILADLESKDSATRALALSAVSDAKFTTADLPQLFTAYFKDYPVDSTVYRTVNARIGDAIAEMKDSASIGFIRDNYSKTAPAQPELKMGLLEILADLKTTAAFSLIKNILLTDPPVKGNIYSLIYSLGDSLELCKQLFPEVSVLYSDSLLGSGMIRLASQLIDSSLATKEILNSNIDAVLKLGKKQFEQMKDNKDEYPDYNFAVIEALGKLNEKRSNDILQEFVKVPDPATRQNAILQLLKNNQEVASTAIQRLAADTGMRIDFYGSLKKIGKEKLFPKEFLNQKKFAEGYIYNYINSDEEYEGSLILKHVTEKTISEKGEQKRYYIFKITMIYENDKEEHLAICGPFDMNMQQVEIKAEDEWIRIFYEEPYAARQVNELFEKYIKEKNEQSK